MAHIAFPATVIKIELQENHTSATTKQVCVCVFRANIDVVFDVSPRFRELLKLITNDVICFHYSPVAVLITSWYGMVFITVS